MDALASATVDAESFLHGPVLMNTEMDQGPPLADRRYSLGANLPKKLLDGAAASRSTTPSSGEHIKEEMVISIFTLPPSLASSRILANTGVITI